MRAFLVGLIFLAASAARADPNPISITLTPVFETDACPASSAPLPVRDASDARWFATGPTSSHDMTELHAAAISPLVNLAVLETSALRLYLFGAPAGTTQHFTAAGWQPRWPFC